MSKFIAFLGLCYFISVLPLAAQDSDSLEDADPPQSEQSEVSPSNENAAEWDIDSLFEEPLPDPPPEETDEENAGLSPASLVKQRGFSIDASYEFMGGIAPGLLEAPWYLKKDEAYDNYSFVPAFKMRTNLGMDAQVSDVFRTRSVVYFQIPDFQFTLGDFFFDYNLYDTFFVRGGKYNHSWGVSPNFTFTDLPARVLEDNFNGDSFILKLDVPVGVGGIQLLAMTRADLMSGVTPREREVGVGGKYNLALRWVDLDLGVFYQKDMPLRGILSIKTTLGTTELYNEWLGVVDEYDPFEMSGAANLGFIQDFFDSRFTVNGEVFYNVERNSFWYRPETSLQEAETLPSIEGLNAALNLLYRFRGKGSLRFFVQGLYAPVQKTARVIPGFKLSPWKNIELYFGVPMALGIRDGYYYRNTPDYDNRPFSIMLLLTLNGDIKLGHFSAD